MLFSKPEGMKYVIIEGNIGAGKSTLLRLLSTLAQVQVIYEPSDKWQQDGLLHKFYHDPERWAYTFQTYAFVTRILAAEQSIRNSVKPLQILERSLYSDRYCFAKNAFEMGLMSALEWQLYTDWFDWLVNGYTIKPDGFIYLRTTPAVCFERMKKRNRDEEVGVSLEYLTKIHEKHEEWLIAKNSTAAYLKEIPVLEIDCNKEFENNAAQLQILNKQIEEFISSLSQIQVHTSANTSVSL